MLIMKILCVVPYLFFEYLYYSPITNCILSSIPLNETSAINDDNEYKGRKWKQNLANMPRFFSSPLVASRSQLLPTKKEPTTDSWRSARKTRLVSLDLPPGLFLARGCLSPLLGYFRFHRQIYSATKPTLQTDNNPLDPLKSVDIHQLSISNCNLKKKLPRRLTFFFELTFPLPKISSRLK